MVRRQLYTVFYTMPSGELVRGYCMSLGLIGLKLRMESLTPFGTYSKDKQLVKLELHFFFIGIF